MVSVNATPPPTPAVGRMLLFHPLPPGEVAEWQTRTVQVRVPERA